MKYLIGLDIGTTAVKAMIVDINGNIVVKSSKAYHLIFPRAGWVEQEPDEMWQAVVTAIEAALAQFNGNRQDILALSLSTQRDTMVCVDACNRPVRNAITWMDARSVAECAQLSSAFGAERVYNITGVKVSPIWTFAFILWMRAHEPENFARTACFGLVHDFIMCRLGATDHYVDTSNACQTMLYDYRANVWSSDLMAYGGLSADRLPHLVAPGVHVGTIYPRLARQWQLSPNFSLISGGGDQQCAALGAGAVKSGDVEIGIGTAANLLAITDAPIADPQQRMICHRAAIQDKFVLEGAMLAMGRIVEWMKTEIFPYASLGEIDALIDMQSAPGAGGIIALPHFEGAACPYWNPQATGALIGLRLSTSKADIARALMESTGFEIKKSLDLLNQFGIRPASLRISGGASRSTVWMQMLADILEIDVEIPHESDCAALGAALLAGLGCQVFPDVAQAARQMASIRQVYHPRDEYREIYRCTYVKNKALYTLLNDH